jgi:hypothetical protein
MAKTARTSPSLDKVDRRPAFGAEGLRGVLDRARCGDAQLAQECRAADLEHPAFDLGLYPVPGDRPESVGPRDRKALLLGAEKERPGDGVFGIAFDGGGEPQRLVPIEARDGKVDHPVFAKRQGPGLVEDDGGEVARLLEPAPIADEKPVAGAERRGDRRDEGHGKAERVRTGDDEHRHHPHHGEVDRGPGREPADQREDTGGNRHQREEEGRPVGQRLRAGA